MMSNFKYCPMCGTQREEGSQFCKNCNFEFLTGNYVKVNDVEITVEKVSQEEFVKSNDILRESRDKINYCIAKYLNNELINQYNEKYGEIIDLDISEYISSNLNNAFANDFNEEYIVTFEKLVFDNEFIDSKNIFIQWIGENRSHLPGVALDQYKIPIQSNVNNLKKLLSLNLAESDENKKFLNLLNEYLNFENEFLENLIWVFFKKRDVDRN